MKIFKCNLAITAIMLISLTSCGGGSGGGGGFGITAEAPYIVAELDSDGSNNQSSAFASVIDSSTGSPIAQASVSINGTQLSYNAASLDYEGTLSVAPGETVELRVTVNGSTYIAQGTQFASYPTISHPATAETWHVGYDSSAQWSPGAATASAVYGIGVVEAGPSGQLVWPADGYLQEVPINATSYTIPKNSLTVGDRFFLAEIATFVPIPEAAGGSSFVIGGYNQAAVTVTNAVHTALTVTPSAPSVPKGLRQQFHAIGTFSDTSTQDLTEEVTWSTADYFKASVDASMGLAYANDVGSTDITATLGIVSGSATITITPAILVSISVKQGEGPYYENGANQFIGEVKPLVAEALYSDMSRYFLTPSLTWTTSDAGTASVTSVAGAQAWVTALSSGKATITAEMDGVSGSIELTVSDWTLGTTGTTSDLHGLAWSGSKFVAVGDANAVLLSTDGIQWTSQISGSYDYYYGVEWLGTQFAATGSGASIITSPNGQTWAAQTYINLLSGPFIDIAWSGSQYVAVGSKTVLSSPDEAIWTSRVPSLTNEVDSVVWSGDQFVAVGYGGLILTSPDGINWTSRQSGTIESLQAVTWSGTQFVAAGFAGTILTSPDGIAWTSRTSGTSAPLYDVAWSGTQFAAVGGSGTGLILTSPDGVTWTQIFGMTKPYSKTLTDAVWMGRRLVAVGYGGTVLVSP